MRQLKINQQITYREERAVELYFREVKRCEMVSVEEEVELAMRIRNGDDHALRRLVEGNLRFVVSVAKQFQNQGLSFADLINEGNLGLVKAAKKFDETRGFKFISYAVWWIRQAIMQAILEQTRVVRLPLNRLTNMHKISKAFSKLEQQYEREPSNVEIAEFLNLEEKVVFENDLLKSRQMSFDQPLSTKGEDDSCLYDLVESDYIPAPDSGLVLESVRINLIRAISMLDEKEAEIINLTFGLNDTNVHSLHEIAYMLGISSERVRQIKNQGLEKLKQIMSGKHSFFDS